MPHVREIATLAALVLIAVALLDAPGGIDRALALPPAGGIETFAGGGEGDGGPATSAAFWPGAIESDGAGGVYFSQYNSCRIRHLVGGILTTVAGNSYCTHAPDGPVTTPIGVVTGLAVHQASGDIYFSEFHGSGIPTCYVRKISGGMITTVAGSGSCTRTFGEGVSATSVGFQTPGSLAVSGSGDIYITEGNGIFCYVRKVSSGLVTTVAGNGSCIPSADAAALSTGLGNINDLAVDPSGDLHITSANLCTVRKLSGGSITTVAGTGTCGNTGDGGSPLSANITSATMEFSSTGDLYLGQSCGVRVITGGAINAFAGTGTCGFSGDTGLALLADLTGGAVALDTAGNLYVTNGDGVSSCRIRVISGGNISTVAGIGSCYNGGDGGLAKNATLSHPRSVAIGPGGDVYVVTNCRLRKISSGIISTIAGKDTCGYGGDGGLATAATLGNNIGDVVVAATGDVYISDHHTSPSSCRIRRISGGIIDTVVGTGACGFSGEGGPPLLADTSPTRIGLDPSGNLVFSDSGCRIRRVAGGVIGTVAGTGACTADTGDGGPPLAAGLNTLFGLDVDTSGSIFVGSLCRARKISSGYINTVVNINGLAACNGASGDGGVPLDATIQQVVSLDVGPNGDLYLMDSWYADYVPCRLRRVAGSTIVSIAGSLTCGYSGDGGPASAALISRDGDLAVDLSGYVYIADMNNDRIRVIAPADTDSDTLNDFADTDDDGDGILDAIDNCPIIANGGQANNDRNFIDQTPPKSVDDLTLARSDGAGDACDADDDNDGLSDALESGGPPCASATLPTDPLLADSDDDRALDGAECVLSYNPASATSVPPAIVGSDVDADGLPDALDPNDANVDSDGDGLKDGLEFRGYNTSVLSANTDADVCGDAREVASLNVDLTVSSGDQGLLASEILRTPPPAKLVNYDLNKDGLLNSGDQGLMASRFGACP